MNLDKREKAYARGLALGKSMIGDSDRVVAVRVQYWHDAARCLANVIGWPQETVRDKVLAFHRERLDAVPDLTVYPELRGYRDLLDEEERGLRDAGLDDTTIALSKTLNFWRDTRLVQE